MQPARARLRPTTFTHIFRGYDLHTCTSMIPTTFAREGTLHFSSRLWRSYSWRSGFSHHADAVAVPFHGNTVGRALSHSMNGSVSSSV
eukprot:3218340-Amphidinium_carterae.1